MLPRHLVAALLATAATAAPAAPALASPWALAPYEYHAEISGSAFSAGTAYDAAGDRVPLTGGGLYERRALGAVIDMGWKRRWSASLGVPFISVTQTDRDLVTATTQTGLGDLAAALQMSIWSARSAGALRLGWSGPTGYNRRFEPGLGDGVQPARNSGLQSLSAGLEFGVPAPSHGFLTFGGGYRYRFVNVGGRSKDVADGPADRQWADLLTADAALGLGLGQNVQLTGLYHGEYDVDHGDLYGETQAQLAGVRLGYRVDERLEAFAGSWHSPSGTNVLHVDTYYAGVGFRHTRLARSQGLFGRSARP